MKVLRVLNERLEEVFLVILMAVAVILVAAQVITRNLGIPLPWSEEIARFIFLWLIWVGAAYATKEKKHIAIDIISDKFKGKAKIVSEIFINLIWFGFLIFMIYYSTIMTMSVASGGAVSQTSGVPMWVPYASVPVGVILMLFRMVQNLILDFKKGSAVPAIEEGGAE
ncbi:MAG: TRAP transporter small permease [Clostridiales Family XIII bacterium]|jgi:TRAP-type C4-dicarboxylate transport system permease small subunit|nr:TRAP transporter small permease [Clostridiales Family XIII bacterium]